MFKKSSKQQPEMNPIDLLRKYAPYLIGAGAATGTIIALFYHTYTESSDLVHIGFNEPTSAMEESANNAEDVMYSTISNASKNDN